MRDGGRVWAVEPTGDHTELRQRLASVSLFGGGSIVVLGVTALGLAIPIPSFVQRLAVEIVPAAVTGAHPTASATSDRVPITKAVLEKTATRARESAQPAAPAAIRGTAVQHRVATSSTHATSHTSGGPTKAAHASATHVAVTATPRPAAPAAPVATPQPATPQPATPEPTTPAGTSPAGAGGGKPSGAGRGGSGGNTGGKPAAGGSSAPGGGTGTTGGGTTTTPTPGGNGKHTGSGTGNRTGSGTSGGGGTTTTG